MENAGVRENSDPLCNDKNVQISQILRHIYAQNINALIDQKFACYYIVILKVSFKCAFVSYRNN